jgi:hypothetical protein
MKMISGMSGRPAQMTCAEAWDAAPVFQSSRCVAVTCSAEEIHLADLDAVVAQDGVGGAGVEIQVGQHEIEQVAKTREVRLAPGQPEIDVARFAAVDLIGAEPLHEGDGPGDARLQFGEAGFVVIPARHFGAGQTRSTALDDVGRDLHLARQREHVGCQPRIDEY